MMKSSTIPLSIPHMILEKSEQFPNKPLFYIKRGEQYQSLTYKQFVHNVNLVACSLFQSGVKRGDRIAILSENRIEWPIVDVTVMGIGGIVVPIYPTLTPSQIAYILNDSETTGIFVSNESQLEKILECRKDVPSLKWIVTFDPIDRDLEHVIFWEDFLELGYSFHQKEPDFFKEKVQELNPEECTTIVYTSGTTGNPKGVMLCQRGFMHDIVSAESVLNLEENDIFLSFLPLSHLYERIAGHYTPMWKGASIAYAESLDTVVKNIEEIHPTVIVAVPRFYEKVMSRIRQNLFSGSALKVKFVQFLFSVAASYIYGHRIKKCFLFPLYELANKLVFTKIRNKLSGRIRYLISGGAPLSPEVLRFFEIIGFPIVEGYGLTETHLIVTLTPYKKHKYGSCGKPIPGVEVKIAEDGEILVKGPTVMLGYYKNEKATRDAIDADGWFHTGDVGYMDEDHYLFITGRKKHIIVTSGGKNISPAPVEDALKQSPYVQDAALIGNGRKFPIALIVPDVDALIQFAKEHLIEFSDWTELIHHEKVKELYYTILDHYQNHLARYEKAKHFILLDFIPSVENGFLTPSLKLRKEKLEQFLKQKIDELYNQFN